MKIIFQSLRDRFVTVVSYSAGAILLMLMYMAIYPTVKAQADQLNAFLEHMPKGIMQVFGMGSINYAILGNYLSSEQFSLMWPILVIFLTISLGAGWLAGEIEKGTIELSLAQPISRLQLFWGRYTAAAVYLAVFCIASIISIIPIAAAFGFEYSTKGVLSLALVGFLFGLSILSASFFFSAMFSERSRVYLAMSIVLVGMYALNIIASLKPSLSSLGRLSFFHYFVPSPALSDGIITHWAYPVFIGASMVCTLFAAWIFVKRDIVA